MLWPDTFNNFFRPEVGRAATRVLEALGYEVALPDRVLCCGRPLYDWGMLDEAKRLWRENLASLAPALAAGTPIVGLEPACVSAFRDELPALFRGNEQAAQLAGRTRLLTEFLDGEDGALDGLAAGGRALVQFHCHHHAVLDTAAERRVLERLGLEHEVLAAGCCGMAGAFGFEAKKYDVAMAIGEQALLPAVRQAGGEKLILADGFSCREQIEQATGARTWHVAEVLAGRCA
jgi:Fe-S oxidoreductase